MGFRNGIRRMTGFKKRRSVASIPSALENIDSNTRALSNGDRMSIQSGLKSPGSIKSSKSSWSNPPSATRIHYDDLLQLDEKDATKRTRECRELLNLRTKQREERSRFVEFQKRSIAQLRLHHQVEKQDMIGLQRQLVLDALDKVKSHPLSTPDNAKVVTRTRRPLKISNHATSKLR